jgi:hypothetical protein
MLTSVLDMEGYYFRFFLLCMNFVFEGNPYGVECRLWMERTRMY